MATSTTISHSAADKKAGMTLDELADFLAETQRAGIPPTTYVKVVQGWRSQLQKIEVVG